MTLLTITMEGGASDAKESSYHSAVQSSADVKSVEGGDQGSSEAADTENSTNRVRVEWVAKSLTSIAPRYQAKSGECSVYSCLTQFTAPELLTGKGTFMNYVCKFSGFLTPSPLQFACGLHWQYPLPY